MRYAPPSPFYLDLKGRVANHFARTGRPRHGGVVGLAYACAIVVGLVTLHAIALSGRVEGLSFFAVQLALGLLTYLVAVGIAHDASHGALTPWPRVNRAFTRLFDLAAVSSFVWTLDHLRSHHAHANVAEHDNALESAAIFRTHPDDPHRPWHRWQHVYAWALYAGASLHRWFLHDWARLLRGRSGRVEVPPLGPAEGAWFLLGLVVRNALFLALPILWTPVPAAQVIAGFVAMNILISGLLVVAVQLTHQSDGSDFYPAEAGARGLDVPWDLAVVRATTDFAPESRLVTWLTGGLNLHTAHHLFPTVHHRHLIEVNRLLVACARDHGVPLRQRACVGDAIVAHHRYLRELGLAPVGSSSQIACS